MKQILKETSVSEGDYKVSITREADNWYSTLEGVFVRTKLCLSLAIGDDAVLRMNGFGGGTIIFVDDREECDIEGLFSKVRL